MYVNIVVCFFAQINEFIHQVAANYSSVAELHHVGQSHENRSISLLKIGNQGGNVSKPAIFIEAGIHPNEVTVKSCS